MKKKLCSVTIVLALLFTLLAAPATRPRTVSADSERARLVAALVNRERAANGLSYLMYSSELCNAADVRAAEIAESFSHTRPDGTRCFTVLDEYGISYSAAGENIAAGQRSAESVMNDWMNSSGHRANILNGNYNCIGVACAYINGRYYWVQLFARSGSLSGPILVAEEKSSTDTTASTTKSTTSATKATTSTVNASTSATKATTSTVNASTSTTKATTSTVNASTSTAKATTSTVNASTPTTKPSGVTVNPSTLPTSPDGATEAPPPAQYDNFLDVIVGALKSALDSVVDFFRSLWHRS